MFRCAKGGHDLRQHGYAQCCQSKTQRGGCHAHAQVAFQCKVEKALGGTDRLRNPFADRKADGKCQRAEENCFEGGNAHNLRGCCTTAAQHCNLIALAIDCQTHHQPNKGKQQADDGNAEGIEQNVEQARGNLIFVQRVVGRNF